VPAVYDYNVGNKEHGFDLMLTEADIQKLIAAAMKVRDNAYCPYSNYAVGSALLTESGEIICGCNVENVTFPAGVCAETNAMTTAIAAGHRQFTAIAVVTGTQGTPCGVCRQVLIEHAPELTVICADLGGNYQLYDIKSLLPNHFAL